MMQEAELCIDFAHSWDYFKEQVSLNHTPVFYTLTSRASGTVDDRYEVIILRMFFYAYNPRRLLVYTHASEQFFFDNTKRKRMERLFVEACQSVAQEFKATRTNFLHFKNLTNGITCRFNPFEGKQLLKNYEPGPEIEV